ncbi:MAG: thioredoxin family protein [Candidatus Merdivicinus sp.]|jgi:small redox-active disulfide protein 2
MTLFNFGKKKEQKVPAHTCCCSCSTNAANHTTNEHDLNIKEDKICCIKVLGAGCKSCHELYENAKQAVKDMGLSVEVEYITDMQKIMEYGVMSMPALVVNEKVVSMGKVLKTDGIMSLLYKLGVSK